MTWVLIAIGGAAGAILRHIATLVITAPLATVVVNIIGCFLMGMAFVLLAGRGYSAPLVMTGLLGGFTTFSAFSLDALRLAEAGRIADAVIYVAASVLVSLVAVTCGAALARSLA